MLQQNTSELPSKLSEKLSEIKQDCKGKKNYAISQSKCLTQMMNAFSKLKSRVVSKIENL